MNKKQMVELAHAAQVELARRQCLYSTLFHAKYFFEKTKRETFIENHHHRIICNALDKVFSGEITRLIINVAPRYSKTEMAVKTFIQKGLAHNPASKYIHLSYSDSLAIDNSERIRDACKNPYFRQLYPEVEISKSSDSKKKWNTTAGGGVYATSAAGQVTGFGAGSIDQNEEGSKDTDLNFLTSEINELDQFYVDQEKQMEDGSWKKPFKNFGGAIVIDDPIKPDDALSDVKRKRINDRFNSTIRNRVNSKKTPIVIVHQRVHEMDLTGYLLSLEPEEWTVIKLPCLQPDGTALWDLKHTVAELLHLKKISPYVFECQYQQDPKPIKKGGEFYKLFDYKTNVLKNPKGPNGLPLLYDPRAPLHVTYDFNVRPYMAIGVWQVWGKRAVKIDEVAARSPHNRTEAASRILASRYADHDAGLFVYGDPSGKKEDTRTEEGSNDFVLIQKALQKLKPTLRLLDAAPSVAMRGNFINALFASGYDGVEIFIGDNCVESLNDYQYLKEDSDGSKLKEKTKDESGIPYEKYGHFSDGDDYFICRCFAGQYARWQKGGPGGKLSMGKRGSDNSY